MPIMSDKWIKHKVATENIIEPFISDCKRTLEDGTPVTSYGLSSFGYDLRLNDSFRLFNVYNGYQIDAATVVGRQFVVEFQDGRVENIADVINVPMRDANDNKLLTVTESQFVQPIIDPVNFDERLTTFVQGVKSILIPPNGFMLGVTMERLKLGRDFTGVCMEKSTLARCGLCVTVTPAEAGWEGYLTLEISNKTNLPIKLTPGMGITQLLYYHGNEPCETSYTDRAGIYLNQPALPVLPSKRS